ncbi:MAG: recombinase family protein [Eubacteriales bacterium]|nr:recombinase family protein [Eubacteriales bacterium]
MKNRKIPFGYEVKNGANRIIRSESIVVSEIFAEYLNGCSLKYIAEMLTDRHVEYLPGESQWSKNRIKRMLEDVRYSGTDEYPQIIEPEKQKAALKTMKSKYLIDHTVLSDEMKIISPIIRCGCCGTKMKRFACKERAVVRWHCQNEACKLSVGCNDDAITQTVIHVLTDAKNNALHPIKTPKDDVQELEVRKLNNDIVRNIAVKQKDDSEIVTDVLRLASMRYNAVNGTDHITEYINQLLGETQSITIQLLKNTAHAILLDENSISIKFADGNMVRKEMKLHGSRRNTKSHQSHSGETGA